ncbi:MAG: helix-turn-helix transcriptional regulator [Caldilineaceae bacterium]
MNADKRQRLEAKEWKVGSVSDFLELTPAESMYIELKLALSQNLRERRKEQNLSQIELAERLHSSQSRVAKMESNDSSVSLDLLVRSLLALGVTPRELADIIAQPKLPETPRHVAVR